MPRNNSGDYTLPAGNPVVADTIIAANWANNTMGDIARELTFSLDRNGNGGMLVPIQNGDGTELLPGITWTDEVDTGFYRFGTNDFRATVNGGDVVRYITGTTIPFEIWNGSAFVKPIMGVGESPAFTNVTSEGGVTVNGSNLEAAILGTSMTVNNITGFGIAYGHITSGGAISTSASFGIASTSIRSATEVDVTFTKDIILAAQPVVFVSAQENTTNLFQGIDAYAEDKNDYGNDRTITVNCHNPTTGQRSGFSIFAVVGE